MTSNVLFARRLQRLQEDMEQQRLLVESLSSDWSKLIQSPGDALGGRWDADQLDGRADARSSIEALRKSLEDQLSEQKILVDSGEGHHEVRVNL